MSIAAPGSAIPGVVNKQAMERAIADALATNKAFVAIASPNNLQNAAQIKALTRQQNAIIRLISNRLEATD